MIYMMLSFLIPIFAGFLVLCLICPDLNSFKNSLILKSCLAVGLGFGIFSLVFFLWLVTIGSHTRWIIILDLSLLFGLFLIFLYSAYGKNHNLNKKLSYKSLPNLKISRILDVSFYVVLISSVITFIYISLRNPYGKWDAMFMWNMRAKSLFNNIEWIDTFSNKLAGVDYPLLLPSFIARSWQYIGEEAVYIPALVAMFFTFATVGLIYSALSILRNNSQGFLSAIFLMGTPIFIAFGASQGADVPIGFFFLAALVLICLMDILPERRFELIFLSGLMAGMSAWTKNEGLLFVLSVVTARFIVFAFKKQWKQYFQDLLFFALGSIPIFLIIIYFKTAIGGSNDIMSGQGLEFTIAKLTDIFRYFFIAKTFAIKIYHFNHLLLGSVLILAIYLTVLGLKIEKKQIPGLTTSIITVVFMFVGYFFIYVITPQPLKWHLHTSLNRIILQMWPSLLFVFFLLVSTPEQKLISREVKE